MKKTVKSLLIITMLLSAILLFAGCGNKKDNKSSNPIVGVWKSDLGDFTYHFNDDGSGYYDVYGTKMEFTYTAENGKISILFKENTVPFETDYNINGDTLNVKDSFGNDTLYKKQ